MALSSPVARQICTKAELELFSESLSRNVIKLDTKRLKSRIGRARKLRDKYRQRANRQDREARGKQTARRSRPSRGSAQTRKKEQLFAETLDRFEKQLAKLESPKPKRATKKTKKRAPVEVSTSRNTVRMKTAKKANRTVKKSGPVKKAAKRKAVNKNLAKTSTERKSRIPAATKKATTAAKKARNKASGRTRIEKHLSAQNRRKQARRDAR